VSWRIFGILALLARLAADAHHLVIIVNTTTMSQDRLIKLMSKEAKGQTIYTKKNKKSTQDKLKLRKYSKKLRKHIVFTEAKK
jgi:large subunit ribosomal protein L33